MYTVKEPWENLVRQEQRARNMSGWTSGPGGAVIITVHSSAKHMAIRGRARGRRETSLVLRRGTPWVLATL